jgi:hypothetical protein
MIAEEIQHHYERVWNVKGIPRYWYKGPIEKLNSDFCVLEFPSTKKRDMWTYATCCLSDIKEERPIEIHIFSSRQDESLIELLTTIAYYHKNNVRIELSHTVNFGRAWQATSKCEYGFISLPYLDGPDLENGKITSYRNIVKFYWLIPVTEAEVNFKIKHGSEELEDLFDTKKLDYLNPARKSLV